MKQKYQSFQIFCELVLLSNLIILLVIKFQMKTMKSALKFSTLPYHISNSYI